MTDERDMRESDGAWLEEIGRDLNIEPSPAFAVRVRAAVEAEGAPGSAGLWNRWFWAGAGLAGASAVVATMMLTRHEPALTPSAPQQAAVAPIPTTLPPTASAPVSPEEAPITPTAPSRPVRVIAPAQQPGPSTPAAIAKLDLTVVTDQPDVYRRLWQGVPVEAIDPATADGRFREALVASTAPMPAVSEIVVTPISVKPLDLPDAASGRSGGQRLIADERATRSR